MMNVSISTGAITGVDAGSWIGSRIGRAIRNKQWNEAKESLLAETEQYYGRAFRIEFGGLLDSLGERSVSTDNDVRKLIEELEDKFIYRYLFYTYGENVADLAVQKIKKHRYYGTVFSLKDAVERFLKDEGSALELEGPVMEYVRVYSNGGDCRITRSIQETQQNEQNAAMEEAKASGAELIEYKGTTIAKYSNSEYRVGDRTFRNPMN